MADNAELLRQSNLRLARISNAQQPAEQPKRNLFVAGVSSGIDQLQALSGRGLQAFGDAGGSQAISDLGRDIADRNFAEAAANGRPDLENRPDLAHWTDYPAWLGYQGAKQLPTIAASLLAYKLGGAKLAGMIPEELAAAGAAAPRILGGGGLRAGASALEAKAAQETGAHMIAGIASQAPVMYPQSVGSMYDEAVQSGTDGQGTALKALGLGVPYSLAEGFEPGTLSGIVKRGLAGGVLKRAATGALVNAGTETVVEGAQTALEQSFRPDLTPRQKLANVVEGAITSGAVGGLFGIGSGVMGGNSEIKHAPPATIPNKALADTVDEALGKEVAKPPLAADANGQTVMPGLAERVRPAGSPAITRGEEPAPNFTAGTQTNITNYPIQPAGEEFDRAVQGPFQSSPSSAVPIEPAMRQGPYAAETEGRRVYPYNTEGTARWARYQDVGGRSAQQIAQERMAAEGPVPADTSANLGLGTDRANAGPNDLFRAQSIALTEQLTPAEAQRRQTAADTRPPLSAEDQARVTAENEAFYGKSAARWAVNAKAAAPRTQTERIGTIIAAVNEADANNRALPQGLVSKAAEIGLTNTDGSPRDLQAEYTKVADKYNEKLKTAVTTGTAQAAAAAEAYKKTKFAPLKAQWEALNAAQIAWAKTQPPTVADAQVADAPSPATLLGIPPANPGTSTPAQTSEVLRAAPPAPVALSFDQRFRGAGAPNTNANVAEEVAAAPVAASITPSNPANMAVVNERWAQGRVGTTQAEVLAAREAAATAAANAPVAVTPVIPTSPLAQRSQVSPAAAATILEPPTVETPMKVVTAESKAQAGRQARATAKARSTAIAPAPVTTALSQGTSFNPNPNVDVAERAAKVQQRLATVANDTTLDEFPHLRGLRQQAVAAAKEHAETGSEKAYAEVMANYDVATGGVVTSRRDPNTAAPPMSDQAFSQALQAATRTLPTSAQSAINVVKTAQDLPPEVLAATEKMGIHPSEVRGVLHNDTVYVVQDHISSQAELNDVVAHEVFGHGGARALYGSQRVPILSAAFKLAGDTEGLRRTVSQFGISGKEFDNLFPARELTDHDRAHIVDEVLAMAAGRAGSKFKTAVLAWIGTFKGALIRALQTVGLNQLAQRLNRFDAATFAATMVQMKYAVEMGGNLGGGDTVFSRATVPNTPDGMNESSMNLMSTVSNVEKWFHSRSWSALSLKANQLNLYMSSAGNIVDTFGPMFQREDGTNPLTDWWEANRMRGVTEQRISHLVQVSYRMFDRVQSKDPKGAKSIGQLMHYTAYNIDPSKTWDEQSWLHKEANADALKIHTAEANRIFRDLRQNHAEAAATYDAFHQTNEALHFAQQTVSLYNLMMLDEGVPEGVKEKLRTDPKFENPMDKFLQMEGTYDNPKASRDYWHTYSANLVAEAEKYIAAQRGMEGVSDPTASAKLNVSTSSIAARVASIRQEQDAMAQSPYFHLGRFGDYVLSFHVKRNEKGDADPAAMDRIVTAFRAAGIEGIEIPKDATRGNAFMRFDNLVNMKEAQRVAKSLVAEGAVVDEIVGTDSGEGDRRIKTFNREDEQSTTAISQNPEWARDLMDRIGAAEFANYKNMTDSEKKLTASMKGEFERYVRQYFLNLLPDTAVSKVMVHRNNVPGYSSDMIRSYLFRTQVGGRALANLYASARMTTARRGMISTANEGRADENIDRGMLKQNVVNELFKRDAERPQVVRNNFIDTWRAVNHAYFLGMSPSYVAVNMTQVGVLLWPELSKRFGFINSAKAIGKVTPRTLMIMKAVIAEGGKLGWKNLPDASISREVLSRPELKLTEAEISFIMHVVNSGVIDLGSSSREQGRVVEGTANSKVENGLRWAAAAGYYSEMTSRLIAALSARELHGGYNGDALHKYVDETVRQSMLSYETWNQARATGRMGLAGQFTPVMTSFMQYTFQLTEKLYRELATAFWRAGKTEEERTASRKFLGAHLAAVATLTGTLGLPMASVFAKAFDSLSDLFGDPDKEPSDIKTSYRNWLALNLGKDVGEVLARGLPRAINVDVSQRAGEQDILPFAQMASKLITDRGKWEDRTKTWALQTLGSPVGMITNVIAGGDKIMQGDFKAGITQLVPNAIKGPVKAYYMSTEGYVDKSGNKLPIDVRTSDVIAQALGFNPARNAENTEEKGVQAALRGDMGRRATILRNHVVQAIESGDAAAIQEAVSAAERFDSMNPAMSGVMHGIPSVLRSRAKERGVARQTSSPLGTKPGLADRTAFGNFGTAD